MDENVVQVAMRIRELREVMEYTEETVAEKIGQMCIRDRSGAVRTHQEQNRRWVCKKLQGV